LSKPFFLYARKSTDTEDKQVRSIGDQLAELRELAQREALDVVDVVVEKQSAKQPGRPAFNEMLDRIERGEATGILAWHPDRLARNAVDGGRIVHLVDTGRIQNLRFPTHWFEPTPQGKFMLSIAFGQSKYYVDSLSENVRRAQRHKTASGVWCWLAPVGYLNDPKSRTVVIDEAKAPLVRRAFELYAAGGYTLMKLCADMAVAGLRGHRNKPLSLSQFQHMLKNPFYYGLLRLQGELHQGAHDPLVTKQLFDQVQRAMECRSKPNAPHLKPYVYRGMLRCGECGCAVTMETQKGHNYLRCTKRRGPCSQRYVREERITEQIQEVLRSVSIPDKWADWMIGQLEVERETDAAQHKEAERATIREIERVDARLDRLTNAYLDGAFPVTDYRRKKAQLLNERQEAKERLVAYEAMRSARFEPAADFIRRSKQAKYVADTGDETKLRAELEHIGSNLLLTDQKLVWEARGAWKSLVAQGPFTARTTGARGTSDPETADPDELAYWSALSDIVRSNCQAALVRVSPLPSPPQERVALPLSAA